MKEFLLGGVAGIVLAWALLRVYLWKVKTRLMRAGDVIKFDAEKQREVRRRGRERLLGVIAELRVSLAITDDTGSGIYSRPVADLVRQVLDSCRDDEALVAFAATTFGRFAARFPSPVVMGAFSHKVILPKRVE